MASSPLWTDLSLQYPTTPVRLTPRSRYEFTLERLRPPVEVALVDGEWGMRIALASIWKSELEKVQVDRESDYIDPDSQDFLHELFAPQLDPTNNEYDEHEADSVAHNLMRSYEGAAWSFLHRIRYLRAPVAGRAQYPKHFPSLKAQTLADVTRESRTASGGKLASKLLYGLEGPVLDEYIVLAGLEHFQPLVTTDSPVYRGAVEASVPMGVSNGVLTTVLMVEWSPVLTHIYPISAAERDEYERGGGTCAWDEYLEDKARTSRY